MKYHSYDRRQRARRYFWRRLTPLFLVTLAAWAAGLYWFNTELQSAAVDPTEPTDAIVVLTGGSERLATGIDLLSNNSAKKLFVSGVYEGVEVRHLIALARRDPAALECCVEPGHGARNTEENAIETAAWVRRNDIASLRLVTAGYHMPRAMLEFRHALPNTRLISHPVFPENVKTKEWWAWPGTARLVLGEYNKYLLAQARFTLKRLLGSQEKSPP